MPTYRSDAEAEIREPVVSRLREIIPGCRIIHEINAESFGNRIDVLAVGEDRLAAVEIKSEKDTLVRLPNQISAMKSVTHEVFAAIHERFLVNLRGNAMPPNEARGSTVWVYPRSIRVGHVDCSDNWNQSGNSHRCLPDGAIEILWREELHAVCREIGIGGVTKLNRRQAIDVIKWSMTGAEVTRMICKTLRERKCVEADPPIYNLPGVFP